MQDANHFHRLALNLIEDDRAAAAAVGHGAKTWPKLILRRADAGLLRHAFSSLANRRHVGECALRARPVSDPVVEPVEIVLSFGPKAEPSRHAA